MDRAKPFNLDPDVAAFADWLAELFGHAGKGLSAYVRLGEEFKTWRERYEPCPTCGRYVPYIPDPKTPGLGRASEHERGRCDRCPHSGRPSRWTGNGTLQEVSREHLLAAMGARP